MLDGFENVNDWYVGGTGATAVNDTSIFKFGNQSIKLNATGGYGALLLKEHLSLDLSTGDGFPLWFYISDVTKLSRIELLITSTTNYSKYFRADSSTGCLGGLVTGWNSVVFLKSNFSNLYGESWNNLMARIRLRIYPTSGQNVSVNFDDLRFGVEGKPKVIITFDDGWKSVIEKAYPVLASNNQNAVAFVCSSGNYAQMNVSELTTLFNAGWDISNHSWSHYNLTQLSQSAMEKEIDRRYDWLVANGFARSAKFFAYPYGAYNDAVIAKLKERHILARGGGFQDRHFYLSDWYDWQFLLNGYGIAYNTSVATIEARIDATIQRNGLLILVFHRIVDADASTGEYLTAKFQEISDYLKTKQDAGLLEVTTFSQYYSQFFSGYTSADLNADNIVNMLDFAILAQNWLKDAAP